MPLEDRIGAQCGFERWPVKVLTDRDRALVDFKPADTTVTALNNLTQYNTHPYDWRVKDEELRVYRVRARLVEMHDEADSDLHLVIAEPDQPDVSMIVEIPAPFCTLGSGHESDYETARADARGNRRRQPNRDRGVGFFDTIHSQTGRCRERFRAASSLENPSTPGSVVPVRASHERHSPEIHSHEHGLIMDWAVHHSRKRFDIRKIAQE